MSLASVHIYETSGTPYFIQGKVLCQTNLIAKSLNLDKKQSQIP